MSEEEMENQGQNKKESELVEFIPKDNGINRLTAINSRNTKDSLKSTEEPEKEVYEEKTCSMKEGSIQGGIFALSSLALGTGAFTLPMRCTQLGLVWYVLFIIIGAMAAYWTLSGLIKASRKVRGEDYSPTVRGLIGQCPSIFLDLIIVVYLFGVFIQYQVIIYSLVGRTYYEFFGDKNKYTNFDYYEDEVWDMAKLKYPLMFLISCLVMPLCLLKDISKMRFSSMFGICALIYCMLVVVIQSPWFFKDYLDKYDKNDASTHANWFDITKGFDKHLNFFTGIANVFFCYSCHPGAFLVFKTLKNHTEKRINTVFFRSICLDIIIYIFMCICGFMTTPTKPEELVIYRKSVFKNDFFMIIGKIALALDLFLSLPANFASYRCSFFIVFFKTDKIDCKRNFLVTIPTLFLSTLIGALYKKISDYISLFGGFGSSIMCYLIPGVLMIVTSDEKLTSKKNILTMIIVTCLTTFGFMGGVQTIRGMISK